jgi:hypothetical protein
VRTSSVADLKMRRKSDRTRWLKFSYLLGLAVFISQIAFAKAAGDDEVCASTLNDLKNSNSSAIKSLAEKIASTPSGGLTNKTRTSHINFKSPEGPDGRLVFEFHSTTKTDSPDNPGDYELIDGSAKFCQDKRGNLKLLVPNFGSVTISRPDGCFRLHIFLASSERTTFCDGPMPSHIVSARERAGDRGVAASSLPGVGLGVSR